MKVNLNVSGFETDATFPDADVKRIHQRLIEKCTRLSHEKQERIVVFWWAPPGSGKS
ncbi:nucleoside/nucleotide kinase family protein, partial [Vibrio parahaemolyticus]|nr:nucleoside/nucleotide kinase family protein [Vibrio parahaemolyticus]